MLLIDIGMFRTFDFDVEAATFLKNPEEAAQYEQRFSQAVASLKALGEGYGSRDEYRYDIARG